MRTRPGRLDHRLRLGGAVLGGLLLVTAVAASLLPPVNPWAWDLLLPAVLLGAATTTAGLLLVGRPGLRVDALLALAGGLLLLLAAVGGGGWGPAEPAARVGLLAALTLLPAAVVAYPGTLPGLHRLVVLPLLAAVGLLVLLVGSARPLVESLSLGVGLLVFGSVWWRFERGPERRPGPGRDALSWLALGLTVMLLVSIPVAFSSLPGPASVATCFALLAVPAAAVLGSRPPHAVEIRTAAARTGGLLLTLLVAFALFSGTIAGLSSAGVAVDSVGTLGLVAVLVAAVFEPVRRLVDRAVERLLFGDRLDAVGAASRFAAELSAADDPVAALRELRSALNLPYAAVTDGHGRPVVESGRPSASGEFALPLTAGGEPVGELRLGLRPGESGPSARDRPVLRILAPALAQALRARSLTVEVAASRERVVTAVEEDRRRLRRDLHDGLGPTLTGVAYATDAARNLLRSDPAAAEELLRGARADTGTAITEVRELVDGLRPAVLDQVGLLPALRQQAAQLRGRDGQRILVTLDLDDGLTELGAATEVAVFRIVTEALTNVARHAGSATASVRLAAQGDSLLAEVGDCGGGAAPWVPGVGLQSMRERVDQLGGTLDVGATATGGRVRVLLPLTRRTPGPAAEEPRNQRAAAVGAA